jgi:aldehyde dehydrogenase (NAD+)
VLESLDGGKPIKESRDVDVPLAAAHFFYYAGWADKLEYAFPGTARPQPLGVAGQIIPWNFPLLMLAWKIAPALACGNTVVLKPAETTPLTALLFAESASRPSCRRASSTSSPAPARPAPRSSTHPDVDKIAFTGSTEVGKAIQRALAGTARRLTLELGGKAANIVFDDAPLDQAVEGIVNGIFFNQGHVCCAGSRLLVQESIAERRDREAQAPHATLRVGDPLDKNTDVGAINSREQLDKISELVDIGEAEGAEIVPAAVRAARARLLVRADGVHQRRAEPPHRARGDLRPGAVVLTFRTPTRRSRRRTTRRTACPPASGPTRARGSSGWPALRAGVVWANTFNKFDPTSPVRRLQGVRLRPRGRPARARGVPTSRRAS